MYDLSFRTSNIEEDMIRYLLLNGFTVHVEKPYDPHATIKKIKNINQLYELENDCYHLTASIKTDNIGGIMNGLLKYNPSTVNIKRCD